MSALLFVALTIVGAVVVDAFHKGVGVVRKSTSSNTPPLRVQQYPSALLTANETEAEASAMVPGPIASILGQIPSPLFDWAEKHGGAPAYTEVIALQLSSRIPQAIPIVGMTVNVISRRPPISGTLVVSGAGPLEYRYATVDLDAARPIVVPGGQALGIDQPPWHFPLQVGYGTDTEVLGLLVSAKAFDVRFTFNVNYVIDGSVHTETVTHNGKPFEISGTSGAIGMADFDSSGAINGRSPIPTSNNG